MGCRWEEGTGYFGGEPTLRAKVLGVESWPGKGDGGSGSGEETKYCS